ncbi:hypothetical protein VB715_03245 [Crocosphaera sp. UHCC 0190]|uniref:hypothetical protein n=1 Tax=Crocosphaera sp. UHCC 0190 TaxID=3110246 RepID=UPI002B212479|nr:hypothetical protein [Crocosphaera sp. UHCC 0190]MEA5508769.1 hypothetical protein [Crocosphaera sp. UHCC 0190]
MNNYTPWNYARFLDYCTEQLLLQRVGGGYRFIHRLLQEHLLKSEVRSILMKAMAEAWH